MNDPVPTTPKIMVIRHAEKPYTTSSGEDFYGVTHHGNQNKEALIVDGWQRAGALVALFDPFAGALQEPGLVTPTVLFAAPAGSGSKSKRPVETITPLADRLRLSIDEDYGRADYQAMADKAMQQSGPVLIAWQHQDIPDIANYVLKAKTSPQTWPGDRFDLVWVFDLKGGAYSFSQIPQNLLAGDLNEPISES